jgi:hypothetical protein
MRRHIDFEVADWGEFAAGPRTWHWPWAQLSADAWAAMTVDDQINLEIG